MLHDLSVVVICYNEENNLTRLFSSLPQGIELIVIDSFSSDGSVEIAKKFNAKVYKREFDNFGSQKNFALSKATRKWTFVLDADEEMNSDLKDSISKLTQNDNTPSAYHVPRKLVFMGKLMNYGKTSDRPIRLFRTGTARFEGDIHEVLKVRDVSNLRSNGFILHHSYFDITDYFSRFNRYTSLIAENHAKNSRKVNFLSHVLRPWFEFINRYFLRLGFLDGYPGYSYALFSSLYTFTKYAKYYEISAKNNK